LLVGSFAGWYVDLVAAACFALAKPAFAGSWLGLLIGFGVQLLAGFVAADYFRAHGLGLPAMRVCVYIYLISGVWGYIMIYEFDSLEAYHFACEADSSLRGISPGGAAAALGITRQGVYSAIKRGTLDMVRITERGTGPYLIIPDGSIEQYLSDRRGRKGPRPGFRQQALMIKDKLVGGVWPNS
jgi:hypothetical protein